MTIFQIFVPFIYCLYQVTSLHWNYKFTGPNLKQFQSIHLSWRRWCQINFSPAPKWLYHVKQNSRCTFANKTFFSYTKYVNPALHELRFQFFVFKKFVYKHYFTKTVNPDSFLYVQGVPNKKIAQKVLSFFCYTPAVLWNRIA